MSAPTRKDWILWGALGCALVGTAHAEYTLAVAAHFNKYVALAVPGALDLYVLRALQQRRDVFVAVLAMVAANVTAHLLTAGVLHEHWAITSAAGALAPLILWRVHSLKHTRTRQELLWGAGAGAVSAPAPEPSCPNHGDPECSEDECVNPYSEPYDTGPVYSTALDPQPLTAAVGIQWFGPAYPDEVQVHPPAPDHVPADWMDAEYPETYPSAPHLRSVPDLPAEYAPGAVHSESPLKEGDLPFLAGAQEYADNVAKPSVRGLKAELKIGQERAERLLTHLGVIL